VASRFAVRDGYAFYRGPAADSRLHGHAAFQVAIAVRGEVSIVDESGACHRAAALVVPPMTRHRMLDADDLLTYFVEPQCAFADRLRGHCGDGITAVPQLRDLSEDEVRLGGRPSSALDPRLVEAMHIVTASSGLSMSDLAARVGLSPPRLRALAREQLGMPLARWRVWARLRGTAEALRVGQSVADAAATGGFADQAHLTRWMREMMGVTPAAVLPVLRAHSRRPT
jgi:AraC-like DNA-binding protein